VQDVAGVEVRHATGRAQRQVHNVAPAQLQPRRVQQPVQRACTITCIGTVDVCNCVGGGAKRMKQVPERSPEVWRTCTRTADHRSQHRLCNMQARVVCTTNQT
jgi:uncharacterized protein YPO0396